MSKNFIETEHEILKFWDENHCFDKLREKNKDNKPFRFLDGPITANNPMGIHHAWGRSIKDIFIRYKSMNGYSCHYRNGFDTQGLWVEVEVEKELGFKDKKDIENYGMDKFTKKCIERITRFSERITEQSKRLGQWMDWENSYFTHTEENITAIWHFLKTCDDNGWITKAHRPMPWCPRCGTSLSEHEMSGSHKDITHTAVFGRLPVKDRDFDILVWTTTPWTLSANVALAVNPDLDYALISLKNGTKPLVLAKKAIKHIEEEKEVIKIFKGEELIGLEYETFFPFLPVQKDITHRIIPWKEVDGDEGSGVVHIAPGCGAEDYELGKKYELPEICPIDENGRFLDNYGFLSGKPASEAAQEVFDRLANEKKLYKTHEYTHSYPVCWRCKTEVLFRLVREWYIKTEEIRPKMLEAASTVKWEPSYIGKRMKDWLENMGDWNISRKRFYGLPLPFYSCDSCGHTTVVGSKEELANLSGVPANRLPELHRPWIDDINIKCPKCGKPVSRVPEVGDVWLDAGITPFSTLGYFKDREKWNRYFPAEWVTEMREQVRLWFYSLLFMSVTLTGKAPYERVLAFNSVVAEDGTKFSKTGFMIRFDEAAEKLGADTIRYLFAGANTASDIRFSYALGDEARRKLLGFTNIISFFTTYAQIDKPVLNGNSSYSDLTDIWLENRMNLFIKKAGKYYEEYDSSDVVREFEQCLDDVSNWYVRVNRKRFWKDTYDLDKENAYNVLFKAIKTITQVMAPILPFMVEDIWQNVIRKYDNTAELSVHLSGFPQVGIVDENILGETEISRKVIGLGLKLRNEAQIKVKQPLPILYLDLNVKEKIINYLNVIKDELNVKGVVFLESFTSLQDEILSLNFKIAGTALKQNLQKVKEILSSLSDEEMKNCVSDFHNKKSVHLPELNLVLPADLFLMQNKLKENILQAQDNVSVALCTEITEELKQEGYFRELLRGCQMLRKEAGFQVSDKVRFEIASEAPQIEKILIMYKEKLEKETLSEICRVEKCVLVKNLTVGPFEAVIKIQ